MDWTIILIERRFLGHAGHTRLVRQGSPESRGFPSTLAPDGGALGERNPESV
jgi:hypothetical protein